MTLSVKETQVGMSAFASKSIFGWFCPFVLPETVAMKLTKAPQYVHHIIFSLICIIVLKAVHIDVLGHLQMPIK